MDVLMLSSVMLPFFGWFETETAIGSSTVEIVHSKKYCPYANLKHEQVKVKSFNQFESRGNYVFQNHSLPLTL